MKKTAALVIVLGVCVCAWLLWPTSEKPDVAVNDTPAPPSAQEAQPAPQQPSAQVPLLPAVYIADPATKEIVDLKRADRDIAYKEGPVRRHTAVKRYLASPLKGDPTLESVIDFLLTNGFSIDDLSIAYVGLMLLDFHSLPRNR